MKKILIFLLVTLIILGIILRVFSLNKDITGEESDFIKASIAIANTGHPVFYQFEQKPNKEVALWHPPLYIYAESLIVRFSTNEIFIRSLNVIAIILTGILMYLICLKFIGGIRGKIIGIISLALFFINFYVLSSSLLIDIDGFSAFFVFLFIVSILMNFKTHNRLYILSAIFSFIFALGNRYPIAVLVYVGIFLYLLASKENRYNVKNYFLIGLIGGIIFLISWTLYSTVIQPGTFWIFLSHNAQLSSQQFSNILIYSSSFLLNIAQMIRLFTFPAMLLFILALNYIFKKKEFFSRIILIYTLLIFLMFIIVPRPAFGYPRYFLTLMPGFFIIVSIYLYDEISAIKLKKELYLFGIICFLASLILLIIFNPQIALYRNDGLIKSTNLPDIIFNMICSVPIFLVFLFKKRERKVVIIIALLVIFFSYNLYFDVKYLANDSRIKDVGTYLKEHTNSTDIVIVPKAIGYYYTGRFYSNDYYKPPINSISKNFIIEYLKESYINPKMNNEFFWGSNIYDGIYIANYTKPDENLFNSKYVVLNYILSNRTPEKIMGDYYIYKLK